MAECSIVSPESTIESANVRNPVRNPPQKQSSGKSNKFVCESTIESSNRRNFIRGAALATAAVGIGGSLLGKNLVPDSSAKTDNCVTTCNVFAKKTIVVDSGGTNIGAPFCPCTSPALYFSQNPYCGLCPGITGILSARTSGSPNRYGLNFFTSARKRVSITSCGKVGVGTCCPAPYAFNVNAPNQDGVHIQGPSSCVGAALSFQTNGTCCQGWEILDTGKTSSQGAKKLNIRNLTTVKDVFTICGPNSFIGINNTAPEAPLCVRNSTCCPSIVVSGYSTSTSGGIGVGGVSLSPEGIGVCGYGGRAGVNGISFCTGVIGQGCSIGVLASSSSGTSIPLVAIGGSNQSASLQEWQNESGTPLTVVNNSGWLGIGTCSPATSLQVNGGISAKAVVATSNYKMGSSDFAVLASGKIKVTLPPASTSTGMIVFVKNTSTSTVTIEAFKKGSETDTIEGAASKALTKQYDSLQLISNGSNEWLVLGNSVGGAFTS
jgi:hypothetical protein